jgi:hypothetical protein
LVNVIETYFVLSGEDAERYRRLVSRKEYRAVQEVELTWADKLLEKGREEGREAGVVEGKRETLSRLLAFKFGALSQPIAETIRSMSAAELDSILEHVLTATRLEELGLGD